MTHDPLEIRRLRYFLAVAEAGSISRAAERLGISQPNVTQELRDLLGVSAGCTSPMPASRLTAMAHLHRLSRPVSSRGSADQIAQSQRPR